MKASVTVAFFLKATLGIAWMSCAFLHIFKKNFFKHACIEYVCPIMDDMKLSTFKGTKKRMDTSDSKILEYIKL